ncbi:oligo-1-6-glucosidase [Penicillium atrosanguineum]|uniref:oligo-1-6-glucosidase n=1 Tax=Penicillium atrosanguineum TaxID=1132637 RepID=UPI0023937F4C|nr:oligo-1-6-glucosidase [Penicillium atrosanguineum]KAJ5297040.1 oligo-1-6-glucosidase [Penicillium atrosanguineum]
MRTGEPPVIDFGPYYGSDTEAKKNLVQEVRHACEQFGFFQLVNHAIPSDLQGQVLEQSKDLFELPLETKQKYDKEVEGYQRGYECLRSQNFEKRTMGDLKEGYYLGKNLPSDDPFVVERRFGQAPNKYPTELHDPPKFQSVMEEYHSVMSTFATNLMQVMALTLNLNEDFFDEFCDHPVAVLRLLHYPPQDPTTVETERGIGAHTDFGAITILLQDNTGGLQVWNNTSSEWVDVTPISGAYVVNLGNLMMQWTNDRYLSNLHRVINKSGDERFSVPFFFSGNPNFTVECLPSCIDSEKGAKHPPVMVHDWMVGRIADTYGCSHYKAIGDLRQELANSMETR